MPSDAESLLSVLPAMCHCVHCKMLDTTTQWHPLHSQSAWVTINKSEIDMLQSYNAVWPACFQVGHPSNPPPCATCYKQLRAARQGYTHDIPHCMAWDTAAQHAESRMIDLCKCKMPAVCNLSPVGHLQHKQRVSSFCSSQYSYIIDGQHGDLNAGSTGHIGPGQIT